MMKLRFPLRHLPNLANPNRPVLSNTLHIRHNNSFLISYTHLSRRKLRMSYSLPTCKRSIHVLYLPIHPRRPRPILRILYIPRNMKHWSSPTIYRYSNSLHRLRPALRTNIILRSYGHHKSTISYPLYRNRPRRMNLRGFSVDKATLTRFFAFHFILPFIITALAAVHLLFLHETGSNNPTGISSDIDKIPFHPYYTIKDILGALFIILILLILVLFSPDLLGDPDNYTPANPLNTPPHIKPE